MGVVVLLLIYFCLHALCIGAYGYFGDELNSLACAARPAFGYFDQPPASMVLLAAWVKLFGHDLAVLRIPAILAGGATLVFTAALARELGGGRAAQVLAATAVLFAPGFSIIAHYYSANAFDQAIWAGSFLVLLRTLASPAPSRWLGLGALLGVGLMNKPGVFCLAVAIALLLLLPRHRRLLRTRGPWLAAAVALALCLPYLGWQSANGWPGFQFMNGLVQQKYVPAGAARFVWLQLLVVHPVGFVLASLGFVWLVRAGRNELFLPFVVAAVALFEFGGGKAYYLMGAYPPLLAAGGTAIETLGARRGGARLPRIVAAVLVAGGLLGLPLCLPLLPPGTVVAYQRALGFVPPVEDRRKAGELPGHFANMFGWNEIVAATSHAVAALEPSEREVSVVLAMDYMDASAIEILGNDLPPVVSPHNAFAAFPLPEFEPKALVVVGWSRDRLMRHFGEVTSAGVVGCTYCLPDRAEREIFTARSPRMPLAAIRSALVGTN